MRRQLRQVWRDLDTRRRTRRNMRRAHRAIDGPPALGPVWPLPRAADGPSDAEVHSAASRHPFWLYGFAFEGGLSVPGRREAIGRRGFGEPERPLQRFRHFMPWLLDATGGSLRGKRVLDIACNSGFWSIQCALLGADEVVGFDARPDLLEQANLIKAVAGVEQAHFRVLDFWDMDPATLGGTFDVVLNLGILYHLPRPLDAIELTRRMAREYIVLDTSIQPDRAPVLRLNWEEPEDIGSPVRSGLVMYPSKRAVEVMLKEVGLADYREIPLRSTDMPAAYLRDERASWLIRVPARR
jgi:2-polyprenyl-3-methyl-5-hydroxy-6-metoxy-1,4-benzoquinol methylase